MKFSAVIVAVAAAVVCLVQPAAAEEQAVHLRVHVAEEPPICYKQCESGKYCANGTDMCRGPKYHGECFNPAIGQFQKGCAPGFSCQHGKCNYA